MLYAGVVGDYGNVRIFVRSTSSGTVTGIQDANGTYVTDEEIPFLNAAEGLKLQGVIAWSSRLVYAEVVPADGDVLVGF
ncbi:unnamed protein product [Rotaria sordida]|uniref:Uncharacterized protein n=1 Tax=Rotaria sordida TaxID=392033 RepID=A0A815M8Q2_9BILA|nr:unnamed protein product [Rotaria sordida]CAF4019519.1 unnamed protein product [Rotaria sordida]